ncbi:hypothetical protein HG531_005010 [Fusarium graminearum]|nr:hypothetical protein HG531_005010 [Fusarium graminearum]
MRLAKLKAEFVLAGRGNEFLSLRNLIFACNSIDKNGVKDALEDANTSLQFIGLHGIVTCLKVVGGKMLQIPRDDGQDLSGGCEINSPDLTVKKLHSSFEGASSNMVDGQWRVSCPHIGLAACSTACINTLNVDKVAVSLGDIVISHVPAGNILVIIVNQGTVTLGS